MLNSRNIISWVQGNCFIARNNGPVFTVGPLITLLLSIALFGDYTWRRFNNDRSLEPSPFCIVEFSFIAKIMFSCNFFSRLKNGGKRWKIKEKGEKEVRRNVVKWKWENGGRRKRRRILKDYFFLSYNKISLFKEEYFRRESLNCKINLYRRWILSNIS